MKPVEVDDLEITAPEQLDTTPPESDELRAVISKTTAFIAEHGLHTEDVLKNKHGDNPDFAFLFPGGAFHGYYKELLDAVAVNRAGEREDLPDEPDDNMYE